jgi:hypothetical protein
MDLMTKANEIINKSKEIIIYFKSNNYIKEIRPQNINSIYHLFNYINKIKKNNYELKEIKIYNKKDIRTGTNTINECIKYLTLQKELDKKDLYIYYNSYI